MNHQDGRESPRGWQLQERRHELGVTTRREPGVDVVELHGELASATHSEVRHLLQDGPLDQPHLVLDLDRVSFLDSSGIGAIASGHHATAARDATLWLVASDPHVVKLLTLTGITQTVALQGSLDEVMRVID